MPAKTLHLTKRYFGRAVYMLRHTPPDRMLPLLGGYLRHTINQFQPYQPPFPLAMVTDYLGDTFPHREGLAVQNLRAISDGWETEVYSFTVAWRSSGRVQKEDLILRIFPGVDSQERAAHEAQVLAWLSRAGYPVPRVDRFASIERSPFQKPCLLMERIHGHSLHGYLFGTTPGNHQKYLPIFCGLLARLHAIDWRPLVPDPQTYEPSSPYSVIADHLKEGMAFVQRWAPPGFNAAWDCILAHQHDIASEGPVLTHMDFHSRNILVKDQPDPNGQNEVVIDWTSASLTDYRFDLSSALLMAGADDGWHFREPVLREYERQAGRKVADLDYFDVFACFKRLLVLVLSQEKGADCIGLRAGAEQVIREQMPGMRNVYEYHLRLTGITIPEVETVLNAANGQG